MRVLRGIPLGKILLCLIGGSCFIAMMVWVMWKTNGSVEEELKSARREFQPVIDALLAYRNAKGHYPTELSTLVQERYLDAIPEVPAVTTGKESGPFYTTYENGLDCSLTIGYHAYRQLFIGDTTYATWESKSGVWTK